MIGANMELIKQLNEAKKPQELIKFEKNWEQILKEQNDLFKSWKENSDDLGLDWWQFVEDLEAGSINLKMLATTIKKKYK